MKKMIEIGSNVEHSIYGEGTVTGTFPNGGDTIYKVSFSNYEYSLFIDHQSINRAESSS